MRLRLATGTGAEEISLLDLDCRSGRVARTMADRNTLRAFQRDVSAGGVTLVLGAGISMVSQGRPRGEPVRDRHIVLWDGLCGL